MEFLKLYESSEESDNISVYFDGEKVYQNNIEVPGSADNTDEIARMYATTTTVPSSLISTEAPCIHTKQTVDSPPKQTNVSIRLHLYGSGLIKLLNIYI